MLERKRTEAGGQPWLKDYDGWRADLEGLVIAADSATIFSAMAVEAFLNYYGVLRLSQSYFDRNIERLGPAKKVAALILATRQVLLSEEAEILQTIRSLFKKRDALVHPKTKAIPEETFGNPPLRRNLVISRDALRELDLFFQLFLEIAPDAQLEAKRYRGAA